MSVTFYGTRRGVGKLVALDFDEPGFLNLCNANAVAILGVLGLPAATEGQATMVEAMRAVQQARANLDYTVDAVTRPASDTKAPGKCRVIVGGLDEHDVRDRVERFAEFLCEVSLRGATGIYWG